MNLYGEIIVENPKKLDDMIFDYSENGYPTYNFANVVNDQYSATSIVRGNKYISFISLKISEIMWKTFWLGKPA